MIKYFAAAFLVFTLIACKKQVVTDYQIKTLHLDSESGNKVNLKSDLQLITIMHADVFGTSISSEKLKSLNQTYASFGDKDIVIEKITQYFLSDAAAQIPTDGYMRANLDQFIPATYIKFFVRNPTEAELWYFKELIQKDGTITARDVYYAFLTAEEYKYY